MFPTPRPWPCLLILAIALPSCRKASDTAASSAANTSTTRDTSEGSPPDVTPPIPWPATLPTTARHRIDGKAEDWKDIQPAIRDIGGGKKVSRMGDDIAIEQVCFDSDDQFLYVWLKIAPTIGERMRHRDTSGAVGVISLDVDNHRKTGFLSFSARDDEREKLSGCEYQIPIDIGVFVKFNPATPQKQERGYYVAYEAQQLISNPYGEHLDPYTRDIHDSHRTSAEPGGLIAEGSDGIELALPYKAMKMQAGQTIRILVRERSLLNPTAEVVYRIK